MLSVEFTVCIVTVTQQEAGSKVNCPDNENFFFLTLTVLAIIGINISGMYNTSLNCLPSDTHVSLPHPPHRYYSLSSISDNQYDTFAQLLSSILGCLQFQFC